MPALDQAALRAFASDKIVEFHNARLARLQTINLHDVLKKKNPYLFRAKNLLTSNDLIEHILNAFISSSETENMHGQRARGMQMECLARLVSKTDHGLPQQASLGLSTPILPPLTRLW